MGKVKTGVYNPLPVAPIVLVGANVNGKPNYRENCFSLCFEVILIGGIRLIDLNRVAFLALEPLYQVNHIIWREFG